jgi:tripartite-type tricarboxylate transporter receptor subunit TctC
VPTIAELGNPGFDVSFAYVLMAPAGTPDDIVKKLAAEVQKAMAAPDVIEKNRMFVYSPTGLDPAKTATWLRDTRERWTKVINQAGITAE